MVFPGVLLCVAAAFLVFAGNQINTEYCDEEAKLDTDKAPVFCGGKYFIRYATELTELAGGQKLVRLYDPSGNLIEVRTPFMSN